MVTVPNVLRDVPALRKDPVVAYMADTFSKPIPLAAHVVLDVTDRIDTIVAMLACHRSQVFEWLAGLKKAILDDGAGRRIGKLVWLRGWYLRPMRRGPVDGSTKS